MVATMSNRVFPVLGLGIFLLAGGLAWAQQGGIGEISGFGGAVSIRDGGGTHADLGGAAGANLGRFVHLFGEVNYMSANSQILDVSDSPVEVIGTTKGKMMNYGGGLGIRIPIGQSRV